MHSPFVHGVGGVISADIAVPEHQREIEFYASLLTTGEVPLWRNDLMNNLGAPVIGLGQRKPEYSALPLQWMPHFQVADIASSVACAVEMGGNELMHGKTEGGESQWAVMTDSFGAAFGLIPEVPQESSDPEPESPRGCIAWLSLTVPDACASQAFYQSVIGWQSSPFKPTSEKPAAAKFEMRIDSERVAAEIIRADDELNLIPPVWLIHLPVGNLTDSLRKVRDGGGTVVRDCSEENDAVIRDPVGVYFAIRSS